jgi:hypothetical protein
MRVSVVYDVNQHHEGKVELASADHGVFENVLAAGRKALAIFADLKPDIENVIHYLHQKLHDIRPVQLDISDKTGYAQDQMTVVHVDDHMHGQIVTLHVKLDRIVGDIVIPDFGGIEISLYQGYNFAGRIF